MKKRDDKIQLLIFATAFLIWAGFPTPGFSEAVFNQVILVDNFDQGARTNLLGGKTGGDEELPGGCLPSFTREGPSVFGVRGHSLQLDYDVVTPGSFSYYWTMLGPKLAGTDAATPVDLQLFRYLSFWIRSDRPISQFAVEIHEDSDGDGLFTLGKDVASRVQALAYVIAPKMSEWQKVVIPLDRFRQIERWIRILEVAFIFENRFGAGNGTLYIDDLLFGSYLPEGKAGAISETIELKTLKLNGQDFPQGPVTLQEENRVTVALRGVPPALERLHLDVSWDGGTTWETVLNLYDHSNGGSYEFRWGRTPEKKGNQAELRLGATNSLGRETVLYPSSQAS